MNEQTMQNCSPKCISWSAIVIGALVGVGLGFLLNLFSIAIGLSAFNTTEGVKAIALGGYLGLIIGTIVSMFIAGFTSGFLGKPYCGGRNYGTLYGFTAWCIILLIMVVFATRIGNYVAAYTNFATSPTVIVAVDDMPKAAPVASTEMTVVDADKAAGAMGAGAFAIFILFFVGAVSSAFGGHCGFACRDKCDKCDKNSCG